MYSFIGLPPRLRLRHATAAHHYEWLRLISNLKPMANQRKAPAGGYSNPGRLFSAKKRTSHARSAIYRKPAHVLRCRQLLKSPQCFYSTCQVDRPEPVK